MQKKEAKQSTKKRGEKDGGQNFRDVIIHLKRYFSLPMVMMVYHFCRQNLCLKFSWKSSSFLVDKFGVDHSFRS